MPPDPVGAKHLRTAVRDATVLFVAVFTCIVGYAQQRQGALHVELSRSMNHHALFHWKITNPGPESVYVFDFYLWGPAFRVRETTQKLVIQTTPEKESSGCPPNRFPPMLLLHVRPHGSIEGEFSDELLKLPPNKPVSMVVAYGTDPYELQEKAKLLFRSNCEQDPYNAVLQWGKLVESDAISLAPRHQR